MVGERRPAIQSNISMLHCECMLGEQPSQQIKTELYLLPPAAHVKAGQVMGDVLEAGGSRLPGVSSSELRYGLRDFGLCLPSQAYEPRCPNRPPPRPNCSSTPSTDSVWRPLLHGAILLDPDPDLDDSNI